MSIACPTPTLPSCDQPNNSHIIQRGLAACVTCEAGNAHSSRVPEFISPSMHTSYCSFINGFVNVWGKRFVGQRLSFWLLWYGLILLLTNTCVYTDKYIFN